MGAVISPKIFATLKLTKGEIDINPLIFATIVIAPHLETARADTRRIVTKNEKISADTLRQIGKADFISGDTKKIIACSEKIFGDTRRFISYSEKIVADTLRVLYIPAGAYFMPYIWASVQLAEHQELTRADTLRRLAVENSSRADTLKQCGIPDSACADTLKILGINQSAHADTLIKSAVKENAIADSLLRFGILESVHADTLRVIVKSDSVHADTLRRLVERAIADTCRNIIRVEKAFADTVKRRPLILKYVIENNPVTFRSLKKSPMLRNAPVSIVNSFKDFGITSISASLNERTLSDKLTIETASDIAVDINDLILFQLLDYEYKILVEEIIQRDGLRTINGMYDVDELFYSQVFCSGITLGDNDKVLVTASGYISQIANYFGLTPNIKIQNFTPYHDFTDSNITYSDLLNTVFGWTSQLPQRQINVFIRGDILYCIQHGMEESTFDISDLPHSRPIVDKKLLRSVWNNPAADDDNDDEGTPYSGVISYSNPETTLSIRYENGFLISENSRQQNGHAKSISTSNKNYSYMKFYGENYLSQQTVTNNAENYEEETKTTETITTDYFYKQLYGNNDNTKSDNKAEIYLFEENETTNRKEYINENGFWKLDKSSTGIRKTFHLPVGNGWYVQNVFIGGVFQGSNLSQGKPGNSVSPYTVQQANKGFGRRSKKNPETYEDQRQKLSPIVDTSFPVRELGMLSELTADLLWLNRKIQEEVTVDLIAKFDNGVPSINHVVDFTERVTLDGNEYFLVSNQISFTPRKFIQQLKLIRWYAQ